MSTTPGSRAARRSLALPVPVLLLLLPLLLLLLPLTGSALQLVRTSHASFNSPCAARPACRSVAAAMHPMAGSRTHASAAAAAGAAAFGGSACGP
eukprot:364721-Chlamydomonas_euryale.AAC.24